MEKKVYPIGAEHYSLFEEVGQGVSASVHRAICLPFDEVVAVKILDFERDNCDLNNVAREAQLMIEVDHPNVLKSHCSFVCDHDLWVIMPFMSGGSCLHILKAAYPDGFEEVVIATILREVLKGLEYLHHLGHMHRDIKAGNVLIGARGSIRLGDFGVSACLFDSGDRQCMRNTFVGTPCWMAPEVMEQLHGYDFKADIWSFGITALELAHGHAPFSSYPPMKVLLMTLQNAPPGLDYERDKKFSRSFKQMIASCLVKDPAKRPTAKRLLKHSFFKQARSNDYIARKLLEGLPNIGDRLKEIKRKEEDMLAQKKMADREKEELSQNEYKRGISGWNFNVEDIKAQASLEDEESIADNNLGGSSSSLTGLDHEKHCSQAHCPSTGSLPQLAVFDDNDLTRISSAHLPSTDSNLQTPKVKCENFDGESSTASTIHECQLSQNSSFSRIDHVMNGKISLGECSTTHPDRRRGGSTVNESTLSGLDTLPISRERNELPVHPPTTSSCNGVVTPSDVDHSHSEVISGAPKSSAANGDEINDKTKTPLVQQRGRFKITSESHVELEKVAPSPMLQKSYSMQVINQHPPITIPSPSSDAAQSNHEARSFYPMLHHVLQTNISQRETILRLLKQVYADDPTANHDAGCTPPPSTSTTEKSPLEAAQDREKELIHEVTDLRWRLICVQDELQKLKTEHAQV